MRAPLRKPFNTNNGDKVCTGVLDSAGTRCFAGQGRSVDTCNVLVPCVSPDPNLLKTGGDTELRKERQGQGPATGIRKSALDVRLLGQVSQYPGACVATALKHGTPTPLQTFGFERIITGRTELKAL